tara:strand:+ start:228 stop:401 length:174 start_codon:yes stop_codon:yes gene_type:complete
MVLLYKKGEPCYAATTMVDYLLSTGEYTKEKPTPAKAESSSKRKSYNYQKKEDTGTE